MATLLFTSMGYYNIEFYFDIIAYLIWALWRRISKQHCLFIFDTFYYKLTRISVAYIFLGLSIVL